MKTLKIIDVSISIHTTAKVVTMIKITRSDKPIISIHTTAKVVTGTEYSVERKKIISIHTTAKVVTFSP